MGPTIGVNHIIHHNSDSNIRRPTNKTCLNNTYVRFVTVAGAHTRHHRHIEKFSLSVGVGGHPDIFVEKPIS